MRTPSSRSLALDSFRGMTICLMIVVNTPGNEAFIYSPFQHSPWHGCTPTDLVFPSFLFAVGNAMSFSMKKYGSSGEAIFLKKVFSRSLLIFALGILLFWFPFFRESADGSWKAIPFSEVRIFGVLQRIALCYLIASLLIRYTPPRTIWVIAGSLLIGYWLLLWYFGTPGADPFSMTGNAGYRLDKWVMGEGHMYQGEGIAFDPEGILGTLPATVNVLAGYFAGSYLREKGRTPGGLARLLLMGVLVIGVGLVWGLVFPINKKIWTSSFVLYTIGIDLLFLSGLVYIIEWKGWTGWTHFFSVFGKNPLFIYMLSELLVTVLLLIRATRDTSIFEWVNQRFFQAFLPGASGSLAFAVSYMMVCWCVGKWLDIKKIYIRV